MADVQPSLLSKYDHPRQFEPLLPAMPGLANKLGPLAGEVLRAAYRLEGRINPHLAAALRELVRAMNSYYSNRIEGQNTHPLNIERALKKEFSGEADTARKQRIALAHIEAERELEQAGQLGGKALKASVLQQAHRSLYGKLAPEDRLTDEGKPIEPGVLRSQDVTVGRHIPPVHEAVPAFLARAEEVYVREMSPESQLIAIACAHHRYSWVHPFLDGNGRACRLQTHAALFEFSQGLWSVNRGLARNREEYYRLLSEADMSRKGDLDGRGQLSESALVAWCEHFLQTCLDQVQFMERMFDFETLKMRLTTLVAIRQNTRKQPEYRPQAILPLHHVMCVGPVSRGEFIQMTGLEERTGRKVVSRLLEDGLLVSESTRAPLYPGLPLDALGTLFPALYPEVDSVAS